MDTFEEWFKRLKEYLIRMGWREQVIKDLDPEAWRESYDEGLSVEDAAEEGMRE